MTEAGAASGRGTQLLNFFKARGTDFQHQLSKLDWVSSPRRCQLGCSGASVRRGGGCPAPDTAGPSRLQRPHHRAQLRLLAKMGEPGGKQVSKKAKGSRGRGGGRNWACFCVF